MVVDSKVNKCKQNIRRVECIQVGQYGGRKDYGTISVLHGAQLLLNKQQQISVAYVSSDIFRAVPIW